MSELRLREAVLRPPADSNAFESTVERLAAAIRLGVFTCGEQLPAERDLALQLGVSRVNLREAIAALREADMVSTRRGRGGGTVVTYAGLPGPDDPNAAERTAALKHRGPRLRDALDFRGVVEPGAAFLAATRELSAEQRGWLVACEVEVREAESGPPHRIADSRLHLAIATLSGSAMLVEAVTRVQAALHEMLAAIPVLPRNISHSHQQHQAVVAAILAGNADAARTAMQEHCEATSALLRGLLG
ncbi:MAG: GntR family transcriptional regulator, transcriptional repressor for pyruvate dehydrogenase complex [Pseudonocardiales bacterium]|jgi:GntR family transcriptional repressor for pyruvate dehydrogenase complex|nr:GntR family transcriptional regulator, transcriptional repressor for pyruvate dehydrogenase complex [Pseudonocardiales bacterium]